MRNSIRTIGIFVALLLSVWLPVEASRLGIGFRGGTLGFGVELTGKVSKHLNIRGALNGISTSREFDSDDINYDAELDFRTFGALLDYHPSEGAFRLSAGLFANQNDLGLDAIATQPTQIGNTTYQPLEVGRLQADVDFPAIAPYFGVGWGNSTREPGRFSFGADIGLLYQGSPDVSLTTTSPFISLTDLALERNDLQDDIEDFQFWPVLSFGFGVRF